MCTLKKSLWNAGLESEVRSLTWTWERQWSSSRVKPPTDRSLWRRTNSVSSASCRQSHNQRGSLTRSGKVTPPPNCFHVCRHLHACTHGNTRRFQSKKMIMIISWGMFFFKTNKQNLFFNMHTHLFEAHLYKLDFLFSLRWALDRVSSENCTHRPPQTPNLLLSAHTGNAALQSSEHFWSVWHSLTERVEQILLFA